MRECFIFSIWGRVGCSLLRYFFQILFGNSFICMSLESFLYFFISFIFRLWWHFYWSLRYPFAFILECHQLIALFALLGCNTLIIFNNFYDIFICCSLVLRLVFPCLHYRSYVFMSGISILCRSVNRAIKWI